MLPFIRISGLGYAFPDGNTLFRNISINITAGKTGIVGANGCGKTTLLKLISGDRQPSEGSVLLNGSLAVLEQDHSHYSTRTVTEVLDVGRKLSALYAITSGTGTEADYTLLDEDWTIEERLLHILRMAGLETIPPGRLFADLSGGEATRLLLAKSLLQNADFILLDEPTNHLDGKNRELLYAVVRDHSKGLLVVSHDRQLLRLMDTIVELGPSAATTYGGNYDFYVQQKEVERSALEQRTLTAELQLIKGEKIAARTAASRKIMNVRAHKNSRNGGIPKILLNRRKGNGERTLARITAVHEKKLTRMRNRVDELKTHLQMQNGIKIDLSPNPEYKGKILVKADGVNFGYDGTLLWQQDIDFTLHAKERTSLTGDNGSGKTTFVNLLTGRIQPVCGNVARNNIRIGIIDQKYEQVDPDLTVLENIQRCAPRGVQEHDLRIRLGRFLFYKEDVFRRAGDLSGGEKCRLAMACLLAVSNEPDLIILDEPTNNQDLASIEQMQIALQQYSGALLVISHDRDFLESVGIKTVLDINKYRKY